MSLRDTIQERGQRLDGFIRKVTTGLAVSIGLLLPLIVIIVGARIFLVAFAGLLFALLLRTSAEWIAARANIRTGGALALVIIGLLFLAAGLLWAIGPRISDQVDQLSETIPQSIESITGWLRQYGWGRWLLGRMPDVEEMDLGTGSAVGTVGTVFSTVFSALGGLLMVAFIGVYVAAESDRYRRGLLHLVPLDRRERVDEVLGLIGHSLRWWLIGQFVSMTYLATATTILLWLLDIPLALTLGLFVGLLTFIPYLGPILGFVPIVLFTLAVAPDRVLLIAPIYLVIQSSEAYFVTPMVQNKAVHLPPALILFSEILLGLLVGLLGFILSTPLLVVIMVAVQQLYVDWLGDKTFTEEAGQE